MGHGGSEKMDPNGYIIPTWLVVWNMFAFFHILGIIVPFDEYFSEGLKPPTSYI